MKNLKLSILTVFLSLGALANAAMPKLCYTTVDDTQFCTTDNLGQPQVFIYNAGRCPPCNAEISSLSKAHKEFEGQAVTFASLSGEGYSSGSTPNQDFLKSWKNKHSIPFVVAGKYKDFGMKFGASGSIPFTVIVDKDGNTVKKGNLSAGEVVSTVRNLLKNNGKVDPAKFSTVPAFSTHHDGDCCADGCCGGNCNGGCCDGDVCDPNCNCEDGCCDGCDGHTGAR